MLQYISFGLMTAGILATFFTSKKPKRVVLWSVLTVMVLQSLSFFVFSGIIHKSIAILWIGVGLAVGSIFGAFIKLSRDHNHIIYKHNFLFSLGYLVLLLLNQFIAMFFKVYIPAMLFIAAIAVGMQIGHSLVIVLKCKKLVKIGINVFIFILIAFTVNGHTLIMAEDNCINSAVENYQGWVESYKNWLSNGGNYALMEPEAELIKKIEAESKILGEDYFSGKISADERDKKAEVVWRPYYLRAWQLTLEREYKNMLEKIEQCERDQGIKLKSMPLTPDVENMDSFLFELEVIKATDTKDGETSTIEQSGNEPTAGNKSENTSKDEIEEKGESLFIPIPISDAEADTSIIASGILAGLSALLSVLTSLFGGAKELVSITAPNLPVPPVTRPGNIRINPNNPNIGQIDTPLPVHNPPLNPPPGTRRGDGKIFTKNNGWQNEDFPGLKSNSLKNLIKNLENDVQKYSQSGDGLRTEIVKDMLKESRRELKKWEEDAGIIGRIKSGDNESLYQNSANRWTNRAANMEAAANTANTISFASDIALAIGTAGISTSLTSAKNTLTVLANSKEIIGAAADGLINGKNAAGVVVEYGINKGISMGIGKIFDAGKVKYKVDEAKNSLKALIAAGEASGGNVAQNAAKDIGFTGKVTGAVDSSDNYLKGVAHNLNDIGRGGN